MAVREEADVADTVEPVGNGVQQEPPNEFIGSERHHLGLALMAIVFPGEVDLAVAEPGETRICQRNAVGIAAEIGQHLLGSCERALCKNHPFAHAQCIEALGEAPRFSQGSEGAGEAQFTSGECCL
jgi:hypothetical protein